MNKIVSTKKVALVLSFLALSISSSIAKEEDFKTFSLLELNVDMSSNLSTNIGFIAEKFTPIFGIENINAELKAAIFVENVNLTNLPKNMEWLAATNYYVQIITAIYSTAVTSQNLSAIDSKLNEIINQLNIVNNKLDFMSEKLIEIDKKLSTLITSSGNEAFEKSRSELYAIIKTIESHSDVLGQQNINAIKVAELNKLRIDLETSLHEVMAKRSHRGIPAVLVGLSLVKSMRRTLELNAYQGLLANDEVKSWFVKYRDELLDNREVLGGELVWSDNLYVAMNKTRSYLESNFYHAEPKQWKLDPSLYKNFFERFWDPSLFSEELVRATSSYDNPHTFPQYSMNIPRRYESLETRYIWRYSKRRNYGMHQLADGSILNLCLARTKDKYPVGTVSFPNGKNEIVKLFKNGSHILGQRYMPLSLVKFENFQFKLEEVFLYPEIENTSRKRTLNGKYSFNGIPIIYDIGYDPIQRSMLSPIQRSNADKWGGCEYGINKEEHIAGDISTVDIVELAHSMRIRGDSELFSSYRKQAEVSVSNLNTKMKQYIYFMEIEGALKNIEKI